MEKNYCEGGQDDIIDKQDLWLHYSGDCSISDDDRSVFFSLLGNTVFKQPAFRRVTRALSHCLKRKDQVTDSTKCQASQAGVKDDKWDPSTDTEDRFSSVGKDQRLCVLSDNNHEIFMGTREKAAPASCIQENPQRDPPMRSEHSDGVDVKQSPLSADLDGSYSPVHDSFEQASQSSEGWNEDLNVVSGNHDCITLDKPNSTLSHKKNTQVNPIYQTDCDSSEDLMIEKVHIISDENQTDSDAEGEALSEHLYEKYHRKLDHLLPSHLPGKPTSFQTYLRSTYPQSSCGTTSVYKDARIRCFVAACFPPIKVGSLIADCDGFSFKGDVFPEFSQVGKGNFACQICIPYLKWAILNSHPHSAARSKKATTDRY